MQKINVCQSQDRLMIQFVIMIHGSTTSEKNENGYHAIFFQAKYSEKVKFYALNKNFAKIQICLFTAFKDTYLKTVLVRYGNL